MRTDSILNLLKSEGHLDDFMIAMTEASDKQRGAIGLEFCKKLGFKTSRSSIYENYRRHYLLWQLGFARSTAMATEKESTFDAEAKRLTAQRVFELLASPDLDPKVLVALARLEVARLRTENDSRRVKVLEGQVARAQAIIDGAKKRGKGGLTKETLEEVEKQLKML
jgi:hypothetical protein